MYVFEQHRIFSSVFRFGDSFIICISCMRQMKWIFLSDSYNRSLRQSRYEKNELDLQNKGRRY